MEKITLLESDNGRGRFELVVENRVIGEITYQLKSGVLYVDHTYVIPEEEGKGNARKLVDAVVDYARSNNQKIVPLCSYVVSLFNRNPTAFSDVRLS